MRQKPFKVVITDREYEQIDQEKRIMEAVGAEVFDYQIKDPEKILEVAHDCDALMVQYAKVPESLIRQLNRCKVIARYAAGVDGIDLEAAGKKGIYVVNVRDYCTEEVAVHALTMLLALSQKITEYDRKVKCGIWNYKVGLPCAGLSEKIVGIIGYGKIGEAYAKKIQSFCKKVWVASSHANRDILLREGLELKPQEEIIAQADYISLHAPLTEENRHMFHKETFRKMKSSACLINVARGGLICEEDLAWALKEGQIAGAALDVMEEEPPQKHNPLLGLDNVILTPHVAWYSKRAQERLQTAIAEEVARVLSGHIPRNCANLKLLHKYGKLACYNKSTD